MPIPPTGFRWLHDYVFVPLGGYRRGRVRVAFNLITTLVLCGVWHGASWNFLLFGLLNGVFLVVQLSLRRSRLRRLPVWKTPPGRTVQWLLCFFLLSVTLVLFRSESTEQAMTMFQSLAGWNGVTTLYLTPLDYLCVLMPLEAIIAIHFLLRDGTLEDALPRIPWWVTAAVLAGMVYAIARSAYGPVAEEYIYFEF